MCYDFLLLSRHHFHCFLKSTLWGWFPSCVIIYGETLCWSRQNLPGVTCYYTNHPNSIMGSNPSPSQHFFPNAQLRVPVYSWGSGGWTCVRLPCLVSSSLVVCAPSCRHNSVPIGKVSKGVIFGGSKCDVASCRMAGVTLCDTWTCLVTC